MKTLKSENQKHLSTNKQNFSEQTMAATANAQLLFINTQAEAQLSFLPTFSNIFKDNYFTPHNGFRKSSITKLELHGQMNKQSCM